ncbi:hypothetical protein GCM10007922_10050 [Shewanella decolorationis]|nr:hypothetical protein GCM10007922_10050 [Shewanella decolorationis]
MAKLRADIAANSRKIANYVNEMGSFDPIVIYKFLNCAETRAIPIYIFVGSFTSLVSLGIVSVNFSTKIC